MASDSFANLSKWEVPRADVIDSMSNSWNSIYRHIPCNPLFSQDQAGIPAGVSTNHGIGTYLLTVSKKIENTSQFNITFDNHDSFNFAFIKYHALFQIHVKVELGNGRGHGIFKYDIAPAVWVYLLNAESGLPRLNEYQSHGWPAYQCWKVTFIWLQWTIPNCTLLHRRMCNRGNAPEIFFNSLAPGRCNSNYKSILFKLVIQYSSLGTRCECHRNPLTRS